MDIIKELFLGLFRFETFALSVTYQQIRFKP